MNAPRINAQVGPLVRDEQLGRADFQFEKRGYFEFYSSVEAQKGVVVEPGCLERA
jgi:hypothetical protein